MVFPRSDYNSSAFSYDSSGKQYTFVHTAYGADMHRYSWNYGQNRNKWEDVTTIPESVFVPEESMF